MIFHSPSYRNILDDHLRDQLYRPLNIENLHNHSDGLLVHRLREGLREPLYLRLDPALNSALHNQLRTAPHGGPP